jgi:DNA (cytosine-5)-methyltransferase 1
MPKIINRTEERVHVDSIEPHPANPNDGDVAAIAESIRQNGFYGRVVVRDSTGKILAGEHRWRAAQEVGLTEVPIEQVECDDETAMRILLADNRTAEKAERQDEPLADLLESLETTDDGLTGTGYDEGDLDSLLDDLGDEPVDELSEPALEDKALEDVRILNLYAGIGGNRKLWGERPDVTAVEYNEQIAEAYSDHFPEDQVVVDDAHEYLLGHFQEFDFVWTSPPCPTHSKLRKNFSVPNGAEVEYPDMRLYEEILLLQGYFEGKWVVENVDPWYDPLVEPEHSDRHVFWANFSIPSMDGIDRNAVLTAEEFDAQAHERSFGYDLSGYQFSSDYPKEKVLKNMVHPKVGKAILESALGGKPTG